ncbi:pilus assembly FimT family protein [Helicobacter cappadocius]|uniref:Type II secretion system protein n=1 Tax=Helicobacter cappadocius TaxID=3063998 RepID=A0AA90PIP2_9HELI|nr:MULTISPECIES: type II secretion system protein [unclassified Helicobacter]MDO7252438.1 type II secretion system protein [Helicobacter sp. faydin-H75]MDP2538305.1 type II secretion system protein [Helicobacter sp. faydin-H76]
MRKIEMQSAFSLLEMVISIVILGILAFLALPQKTHQLSRATNTLLEHILYTRHLALNDNQLYTHINQTQFLTDKFKSIDPQGLIDETPMWQIQFHLNGKYTMFSYSIYIDTPRFSLTTHYDGRPMSGDIVALQGSDRRCLSGYNNTNISDECKNNSSVFVRLNEAYGIDEFNISADSFCEIALGMRIYFDRFGVPYCTRSKIKLTKPFRITLKKNKSTKTICVLPVTGYAFISKTGNC